MSSAASAVYEKSVAEVKLLGWDWSLFLAGATILSSTWTITPTGTSTVQATSDGTVTSILLGGGVEGGKYCLVNRVTVDDGRVEEMTSVLTVH